MSNSIKEEVTSLDLLRQTLAGEFRGMATFAGDTIRTGMVKKYIAPNGAPVMIEFFDQGGFEVYGALVRSVEINETIKALKRYGGIRPQ